MIPSPDAGFYIETDSRNTNLKGGAVIKLAFVWGFFILNLGRTSCVASMAVQGMKKTAFTVLNALSPGIAPSLSI